MRTLNQRAHLQTVWLSALVKSGFYTFITQEMHQTTDSAVKYCSTDWTLAAASPPHPPHCGQTLTTM